MASERFANLKILSNIANRIQYDLNQFKEILDLELSLYSQKSRRNNDDHDHDPHSNLYNLEVDHQNDQPYDNDDFKMEIIENAGYSIEGQSQDQDVEQSNEILGNFESETESDIVQINTTSSTSTAATDLPSSSPHHQHQQKSNHLQGNSKLKSRKGQTKDLNTTTTTKIVKPTKPRIRTPKTPGKPARCGICKMRFDSREKLTEHSEIHFSVPTNYHFVSSRKGNPNLQADNYTYFKNSYSNSSVYWNCVKYKATHCPGKAITSKNYTDPHAKINLYCDHNHPTDIQGNGNENETENADT